MRVAFLSPSRIARPTILSPSYALNKTYSTTPTFTPPTVMTNETHLESGRLGGFLQSQKELFLNDLKEGKGRGWTLAMGNEAGDLDSLASSIAYAFLSSTLLASRVLPLVLTPSSLMNLRPENLLAFESSKIPASSLLHLESISSPLTDVSYALVDHNKLLPAFQGQVVAVIDHHDDEGLYTDAPVRLIKVPTGSCSSLVTAHFLPQWKAALSSPAGQAGSPVPPELATLLLSAMLIDTGGLKDGGKATPTDLEAAAFLYPISTLAEPSTEAAFSPSTIQSSTPSSLSDFAQQLATVKFDVSHLSTHDLLIRDYKEYSFPTASTSFPVLQVGLSTVPVGLKKWLEKGSGGWSTYVSSIDGYMGEKSLDIEGVLTSYRSEKKDKHRRELLLVVRIGNAFPDHASAQRVLDELSRGLEADSELALEPWAKEMTAKKAVRKDGLTDGLSVLENGPGEVGRVWKQGNAKATRKQVAPLMRDLIAKLS
ncbi:exopolyphosphatase, partial [Tremellales sp. Uapishka_1]